MYQRQFLRTQYAETMTLGRNQTQRQLASQNAYCPGSQWVDGIGWVHGQELEELSKHLEQSPGKSPPEPVKKPAKVAMRYASVLHT